MINSLDKIEAEKTLLQTKLFSIRELQAFLFSVVDYENPVSSGRNRSLPVSKTVLYCIMGTMINGS